MDNLHIDELIRKYYGFIIKTVSETTHRYVSTVNDDAFSIGLLAFQEAYEKHDEERGPFLNYAKIVIKSRVLDHLRKESRHQATSLDELHESGLDFADRQSEEEKVFAMEIEAWKNSLKPFGITFEKLIAQSPKHADTRQSAIEISQRSSQHPPIVEPLYEKKRLPIKLTAEFNKVTEKVIQRSKTFIISVIVMFKEEHSQLINWIRRG